MTPERPGVSLTPEDRAEIERIWKEAALGTDPCKAIAVHFIGVGLERAAYAARRLPPESIADTCVNAIRAAKGQP